MTLNGSNVKVICRRYANGVIGLTDFYYDMCELASRDNVHDIWGVIKECDRVEFLWRVIYDPANEVPRYVHGDEDRSHLLESYRQGLGCLRQYVQETLGTLQFGDHLHLHLLSLRERRRHLENVSGEKAVALRLRIDTEIRTTEMLLEENPPKAIASWQDQ